MFSVSDFREREKELRFTVRGLVPAYTIGSIVRACDRSRVTQRHGNMELNIAGDCMSSVTRVFFGVPTEKAGWLERVVKRGNWLPTLHLEVRCRKCKNCLRQRARQWVARAVEECNLAARTWMATFTLSPQSNYLLTLRASARLRTQGVALQSLHPAEQINELRREFGTELTKYFKRLRKDTGAHIRYYLVFETHKSGLPHAHALIHEVFDAEPVRHARLVANWTLGHTMFKLADRKAAYYVSKYLTKEASLRVRASLQYGRRLSTSVLASVATRVTIPTDRPSGTAKQAQDVAVGTQSYQSSTASAISGGVYDAGKLSRWQMGHRDPSDDGYQSGESPKRERGSSRLVLTGPYQGKYGDYRTKDAYRQAQWVDWHWRLLQDAWAQSAHGSSEPDQSG